jgi:hypothetical protein
MQKPAPRAPTRKIAFCHIEDSSDREGYTIKVSHPSKHLLISISDEFVSFVSVVKNKLFLDTPETAFVISHCRFRLTDLVEPRGPTLNSSRILVNPPLSVLCPHDPGSALPPGASDE